MKLPKTQSPRILVADDQADVLESLRLLLKGEGYEIEMVQSPSQVIEALNPKQYSLVSETFS